MDRTAKLARMRLMEPIEYGNQEGTLTVVSFKLVSYPEGTRTRPHPYWITAAASGPLHAPFNIGPIRSAEELGQFVIDLAA